MDEHVGLRFIFTGGANVTRWMVLSQAVEVIDRWKSVKAGNLPSVISEKNGIKSYGVDLSSVMFVDIITAAELRAAMQQAPQVPAPSFGR